MENTFTYSLRICISPDFHAEEKFRQLLEFCQEAGIDDVMFILNPEEINMGHPTAQETEKWLAMLAGFRPEVEKAGMTISVNPWTTLLHTDRGRSAREGHDFGRMEDYEGKRAQAVACPLDGKFQRYLASIYEMFGRFGFYAVWVEDDFRLHNHMPLKWGGCFCPTHLADFSKRAGRRVCAADMFEGITAPGEPDPLRKVWLDAARDTMVDLADVIGKAVHDQSASSRVGLMSSAPEVHCIEGRDWDAVLDNLSGDTRPLCRPHLPAYWEAVPRRYALEFQRYSRLSAAMTRGRAELWPELDNLPHTTFSKSHRFARLEMESTLSLCAEGITINIFDMIGNGVNAAQNNEEFLAETKPYLSGVKKLECRPEQEEGVTVLYSSRSAYTLHTDGRRAMDAIQPWETFWAEYLSAYGIACRYSDDYTVKGQTVAVSGQYFRNLTEEQIRDLFAHNLVLMEGEAARTLFDMGLGDLADIENVEWYPLNGGRHCYEQAPEGTYYQGLPEARITAQGISEDVETGDYLHIIYGTREKEVYSVLRRADGEKAGEGLTGVGHAVVFPYGHMRDQYNFLLSPVRQEMLQSVLESRAHCMPAMVRGCQYVTVNTFVQGDRRILLLTNYSTDDFEDVTVSAECGAKEVYEIDRNTGEEVTVKFKREGSRWTFAGKLEHMTSRCFVLK